MAYYKNSGVFRLNFGFLDYTFRTVEHDPVTEQVD
jgi:hypothetical protein